MSESSTSLFSVSGEVFHGGGLIPVWLVVPNCSSIDILHTLTPPIHLGISLFIPKMAAKKNTCQTSDVPSHQHCGHVTALSDICVQCDDDKQRGRSECASDW